MARRRRTIRRTTSGTTWGTPEQRARAAVISSPASADAGRLPLGKLSRVGQASPCSLLPGAMRTMMRTGRKDMTVYRPRLGGTARAPS